MYYARRTQNVRRWYRKPQLSSLKKNDGFLVTVKPSVQCEGNGFETNHRWLLKWWALDLETVSFSTSNSIRRNRFLLLQRNPKAFWGTVQVGNLKPRYYVSKIKVSQPLREILKFWNSVVTVGTFRMLFPQRKFTRSIRQSVYRGNIGNIAKFPISWQKHQLNVTWKAML